MLPQELDFSFPFIVFFYGFLILLVLEGLPSGMRREWAANPWMVRLAAKKPLAWICFIVGGLWSLQNIWLIH